MKKNENISTGDKPVEMNKYLTLDDARIQRILDIKLKIFNKELTHLEARKIVNETFDHITAEEFAFGEQYLFNAGITDEMMVEGMDDILDVFKDVLEVKKLELPSGHPIQTYANEAAAIHRIILKMELKLKGKFIKNEWLELYDQLRQINIHFSRKQHQLFSALERKGFDRPSKIMWTFDDRVRDAIKESYELLQADEDQKFLETQERVIYLVRDILSKESDILYPTSLKLLSDEEFVAMRISDDEIGYCLIDNPPPYKGSTNASGTEKAKITETIENNLYHDLMAVFEKHGISNTGMPNALLDVTTGRLTLEQINLIYKHMPADLSFVDENDEVRFYTDTTHRIFPRSAGVIGRNVQSLDKVEGIINAFRNGEQDMAEFWLDKGDKFIYITFVAVRDEKGNYRGTLESMQEVSHIRSLTGSNRLLNWNKSAIPKFSEKSSEKSSRQSVNNKYGITSATLIAGLIEKYPSLKDFMLNLSSEYERLNDPSVFNSMKEIATLEIVSQIGGFKVEDLIEKIIGFIDNK